MLGPEIAAGDEGAAFTVIDIVLVCETPQELDAFTERDPLVVVTVVFRIFEVEVPDQPTGLVQL